MIDSKYGVEKACKSGADSIIKDLSTFFTRNSMDLFLKALYISPNADFK